MNRRSFLQGMATGPAAVRGLLDIANANEGTRGTRVTTGLIELGRASVDGHTEVCRFESAGKAWVVYEDLRTRDGVLTFVSGTAARVLKKYVEPVFAPEAKPYCGLELKEVCLAGPDLLAEHLLRHGDPVESEVRDAAPPMNSAPPPTDPGWRPRWETFVGTSACEDTMPVYSAGNTRTYHPNQSFPELSSAAARKRYEGLLGGWMPAVRKVFPTGATEYTEVLVFGDVSASEKFIVQTWHRTVRVRDGQTVAVEYGYSYPSYTRRRQPPPAAAFYAGLLAFAEYWESKTSDCVMWQLPDASWADMARYAFVKEQMVRPGGVYPKYGAVDRDYYGPEYDGFQDIFTMSLYANLVCGRFGMARAVLNNYFDEFVDSKGMVNMRGPETAQYGLMLVLAALYLRYTGDRESLARHSQKLLAIAALLGELQDEALRLPVTEPGHGLIHGWCESDACLAPKPDTWWKPYFANSAFAVQGWRELATIWPRIAPQREQERAKEWLDRSDRLQARLRDSVARSVRHDMQPAYVPPLPGVTMTFRESLAKEQPSEQGWTHRCCCELLQPGVLTAEQEGLVFGTMRSYGAMTMGVVANVEPANAEGREILGFISYGFAHALLRHDRIEEYLLFLYAHRYHAHSRGSWTAAEVSGITGDGALFCIPAQQTVPLLLRWMLVFEDEANDRLCLGKALPRDWVGQEAPVRIKGAPTRWGRVDYALERTGPRLTATTTLAGANPLPREVSVRFRLPAGEHVVRVTVNGRATTADARTGDVMFRPEGVRSFVVSADVE